MKIVGISACTAGIAHTYMAQEALEQECKKRGIDCKIETQGGMGIDNELSQEEVDAADVVILAVAVSVEMADRFDAKRAAGRVIEVSPTEAIKQTAALIDRAESVAASSPQEAHSSAARAVSPAPEEKTSLDAALVRNFLLPARHHRGWYDVLLYPHHRHGGGRPHHSEQSVLAERLRSRHGRIRHDGTRALRIHRLCHRQ